MLTRHRAAQHSCRVRPTTASRSSQGQVGAIWRVAMRHVCALGDLTRTVPPAAHTQGVAGSAPPTRRASWTGCATSPSKCRVRRTMERPSCPSLVRNACHTRCEGPAADDAAPWAPGEAGGGRFSEANPKTEIEWLQYFSAQVCACCARPLQRASANGAHNRAHAVPRCPARATTTRGRTS